MILQGNCATPDTTGGRWCYVDPQFSSCHDLRGQASQPWSYEACTNILSFADLTGFEMAPPYFQFKGSPTLTTETRIVIRVVHLKSLVLFTPFQSNSFLSLCLYGIKAPIIGFGLCLLWDERAGISPTLIPTNPSRAWTNDSGPFYPC